MKLTLLPLQNDDIIRVRCDGLVRHLDPDDPLQALLGPRCYGHRVLLSLERSQRLDTGGISWLMRSHKRFEEAGGKLVLFAVPPLVSEILDFLRLAPMLHIAAGEHAACEMALKPPAKSPDALPGDQPIRFPR